MFKSFVFPCVVRTNRTHKVKNGFASHLQFPATPKMKRSWRFFFVFQTRISICFTHKYVRCMSFCFDPICQVHVFLFCSNRSVSFVTHSEVCVCLSTLEFPRHLSRNEPVDHDWPFQLLQWIRRAQGMLLSTAALLVLCREFEFETLCLTTIIVRLNPEPGSARRCIVHFCSVKGVRTA